jgi:hypothetical protein
VLESVSFRPDDNRTLIIVSSVFLQYITAQPKNKPRLASAVLLQMTFLLIYLDTLTDFFRMSCPNFQTFDQKSFLFSIFSFWLHQSYTEALISKPSQTDSLAQLIFPLRRLNKSFGKIKLRLAGIHGDCFCCRQFFAQDGAQWHCKWVQSSWCLYRFSPFFLLPRAFLLRYLRMEFINQKPLFSCICFYCCLSHEMEKIYSTS